MLLPHKITHILSDKHIDAPEKFPFFNGGEEQDGECCLSPLGCWSMPGGSPLDLECLSARMDAALTWRGVAQASAWMGAALAWMDGEAW